MALFFLVDSANNGHLFVKLMREIDLMEGSMNLTKLFVGAFSLSAMLVACGDDSTSAKDTELEELSSSSAVEIASSSSTIRNDSLSSSAIESSSSSAIEIASSSSTIRNDNSSSSSETTQSSSSITTATPCNVDGESKCNYGTLTDTRDGKTYKTVTIGDQVWMAENLNYETGNSNCYNGADSNCTKYGRLYTWAAAVGKTEEECGYENECNLPSGNIQGVCPEGWHLPSKTEFETLFTAVGGVQDEDYAYRWNGAGTVLKSTSGWNEYEGESGNGTDAFGFSALPAGYRISTGSYYYEGNFAYFWSSTELGSNNAYYMDVHYRYDTANLSSNGKGTGFSVRCLKD